MLHRFLIALTAVALAAGPSAAEISDGTIKIGVLNDQSSLYADLTGQGSVVAARMAVEDYGTAAKGLKVEIIFADHQNKADVGSAIARQWYDVDKVDAIVDVPNSGVALAINQITRDKGKPAAVLMSLEDFASYEETRYLLKSPVNAARLLESIAEGRCHDWRHP